jgi:hypothetical protein
MKFFIHSNITSKSSLLPKRVLPEALSLPAAAVRTFVFAQAASRIETNCSYPGCSMYIHLVKDSYLMNQLCSIEWNTKQNP